MIDSYRLESIFTVVALADDCVLALKREFVHQSEIFGSIHESSLVVGLFEKAAFYQPELP